MDALERKPDSTTLQTEPSSETQADANADASASAGGAPATTNPGDAPKSDPLASVLDAIQRLTANLPEPMQRALPHMGRGLYWAGFELSGLRLLWETIRPARPASAGRPAPTFALWVLAIYIGLFVLASERYQNARALNELRRNGIYAQLGSSFYKAALERIPAAQRWTLPRAPVFGSPGSIWNSLLGDPEIDVENARVLREAVGPYYRDLTGVFLMGVDLQDMSLYGADLRLSNLSDATLARAMLADAQLSEVDLEGADLSGADLTEANLSSASLIGANLSESDLRGAIFAGADLARADLGGADLRGADLAEAKNLTLEQIITACGDAETRVPEGLMPPRPCPTPIVPDTDPDADTEP